LGDSVGLGHLSVWKVDTTALHGPGLAQQYIIGQAAFHSGTSLPAPGKAHTRGVAWRDAAQRRGAWLRLSAAERWRPTPLEPWRALEEEAEAEAEEEAGSGRAS